MTQKELQELAELEWEAEKMMEDRRHERQARIRKEPEEIREELERAWKHEFKETRDS